jgi:antirestriction protein ArdC
MSSFDLYQTVTDQIVAMLEAGVVPWRSPILGRSSAGHPKNLNTGKRYRGVNVFLLAFTAFAKGYGSSYWLTYNQAKERGGNVKKGEKASMVVFWKQYETTDKQTGQPTKVPVFRYYNVFNGEQVEGIEIPDAVKFEPIDFKPIEAAEAIAKGYVGGPVIEHDGGQKAFYQAGTDSIHMPDPTRFASSEEYYSTLFHEQSHNAASWIMPSRGRNAAVLSRLFVYPLGIIKVLPRRQAACRRAGIVRVSMDRLPRAGAPVP